MAYNLITLEKNASTDLYRPFYVAEIITTGKNIIQFPLKTGFFGNILHSNDTSFNSIQTRVNKFSTFIPLEIGESADLTELNVDENDDPRYSVLFEKALMLYLPNDGKVHELLIDVATIGTLGKIIIEVETDIAK